MVLSCPNMTHATTGPQRYTRSSLGGARIAKYRRGAGATTPPAEPYRDTQAGRFRLLVEIYYYRRLLRRFTARDLSRRTTNLDRLDMRR